MTLCDNEYFLLGETPQGRVEPQGLWNSTFDHETGVFARTLAILEEDAHYQHSYRALDNLREAFQSLFVEHARPNIVLGWKHNFFVRLSLLLCILRLPLEQIPDHVKTLVETVLSDRSSPSTPWNRALETTARAHNGEILSMDEKLLLQKLYLEIQKIKPLLEAFQKILAMDMLSERSIYRNASTSEKLVPLLTPEGFGGFFRSGSDEKQQPTLSLVGVLPAVFERYCADLEVVSDIDTPCTVLPQAIAEGENFELGKFNTPSQFIFQYSIHAQGIRTLTHKSPSKNAGAPELPRKIRDNDLSFPASTTRFYYGNDHALYLEIDHAIYRTSIIVNVRTGSDSEPSATLGAMTMLYDKAYDGWKVDSFGTLLIQIGEQLYRIKESSVNPAKVF